MHTEHHSLKTAIETAFAFQRAGDLDQAEKIYDQIMCQITTAEPNILFGYGTLLISQEKFGLGTILLQAAAQAMPAYAPIHTNLACAYKHIGQDDLALQEYQHALALDPRSADTIAGLAGFWINKHEAEKVEHYARAALQIDPNHAAAHMHLGMGLLEQGRYEEAWPHYEYRWETLERQKDKRPYKAPLWKGEKVNLLAIHGEQGLGDEILFMGLLDRAKAFADCIVVECADRLIRTFRDRWSAPKFYFHPNHKSLINLHGEPDAYIPMGSLPRILGLPNGKPYLERNKSQLPKKRPLVGLAWKGGTARTHVNERTIALDQFRPILENEDVEFCSVQYGSDLGDELAAHRLINPPTDFDSLQQRIADCDLVITVAQTAMHQAGAMGVDCWVLTPHRAPWIVTQEPWYDSVTHLRQDETRDWAPVIARAAKMLKARYSKADAA